MIGNPLTDTRPNTGDCVVSPSTLRCVALALATGILLLGCGKDPAEEYFAEQERLQRELAKKDKDVPSPDPAVGLDELIESPVKADPDIPPPKLVDVREVQDKALDGSIRVARSVKYYSDGSMVNHGPYTEWHPKEPSQLVAQKFCEGRYEDGKKTGEWTFYFDDGKKAKSGTYREGLPDGTWTYWQPDGEEDHPSRQEQYQLGQKHGAWTYWNDAGQKVREENWEHDVLDGKQTRWHANGQLALEAFYKNGRRDGTWITYDEQGRKTREVVFRDGNPVRAPGDGSS